MDDTALHCWRILIYDSQRHARIGKAHEEYWEKLHDWAQEKYVEALDQEAKS